MSDHMEPLHPVLDELVRTSKGAPGLSDARRAHIHARLVDTLGLPPPGGGGGGGPEPSSATDATSSGSASTAAGLKLVLGATVIAAAAAGVLYLRSGDGAPLTPARMSHTLPPPREASRAPGDPRAPLESATLAAPSAAATAPEQGTGSNGQSETTAPPPEAELLRRALTAIAAGDGRAALADLRRHRAAYADGQHAQERDALTIRALLLLGHRAEAVRAADLFRRRYPSSIHRDAVEKALAEIR